MKRGIVIAAIIGGTILVAAGLMIYFSSNQSCLRDWRARGVTEKAARYQCDAQSEATYNSN